MTQVMRGRGKVPCDVTEVKVMHPVCTPGAESRPSCSSELVQKNWNIAVQVRGAWAELGMQQLRSLAMLNRVLTYSLLINLHTPVCAALRCSGLTVNHGAEFQIAMSAN